MATADTTSSPTPKQTTSRPASKSTATTGKKASTRAKRPASSSARASARAPRTNARPLTDTQTAAHGSASIVDYAERAVLIPVGAALIARDRVAASVGEVISSYSSPAKANAQLRKFERRGSTARNRLEREVRKTRTRLERGLRERRGQLDKRADAVAKRVSSQVEQTQAQVQTRLKDGAELASRVQERVLSLV